MHGAPLRAAAVTGAAIRLTAAAIPLPAVAGVIGAAVAGSAGAAAGLTAAALLVAGAAAYCDRIVLSAMAARPVSEVEHPELYRLVRELSKEGRLPVPRLYLSPAGQPNSLTVGRHPRDAAICCTRGLLAGLGEAELRGVLGHELARIQGQDILPGTVSAALATVITFPAALARFRPARIRPGAPARAAGHGDIDVRGGPGSGPGLLEQALLWLLGPVAALVIRLSVTREREYRADAAGALLSGDAAVLASALRKIEVGATDLPLAPGARVLAVGHLMMAGPFRPEGPARLYATHPPAGERLRRLEALAGYRR